ncbi:MAG: isoaspartyl peptidase/L-asparaginase [Thermoflexales bacterium]|nr:isoaspartyl peptidase/L-asparaginase [Thermoflexales bacterium]
MIIANGEVKDEIILRGAAALRAGAMAADVAEQVARDVEDDADDHSVGFSGKPNILGQVECDACFMVGATRKAGAVAALRGFRHPISVARQVMQRTPHVLLAGEGAMRFAAEIGAERRNMLSIEARALWHGRLREIGLTDAQIHDLECGHPPADVIGLANAAMNWRDGTDTMNVMVRDTAGRLCVAVTTSGISWKYPGRVGDSPIVGAGLYADDRFGAAACMGLGEVTIRLGTSLKLVSLMQGGLSMNEAGRIVTREMAEMLAPSGSTRTHVDWVRIIAIDRAGTPAAFATSQGRFIKVQGADDLEPRLIEAEYVPA